MPSLTEDLPDVLAVSPVPVPPEVTVGFTIHPGTPTPTRFATYDDHRMAMSLSLLGLRTPGIEIANPGCVAKTYPGFFTDLARLQ